MTLRETYARDICQNPGVPLEDCPRKDEHYARADEVLAGLTEELAALHVVPVGHGFAADMDPYAAFLHGVDQTKAAIVAALEEPTDD